jgi:hypothetical protein
MCECDVFVCVRYPAPEHNHFSADKQNQLRISATPNLCTPPRSHARHRRLGRLVVWRLCGRRAALRRAVRHRVPRPVAPAGAARVRQGVHAQVPQFQAGQGGDQVRQQVSGCATVDEMKTSRHTQVDLNGFHCPPPMMIVPLVPFFPCFFFFFFFKFIIDNPKNKQTHTRTHTTPLQSPGRSLGRAVAPRAAPPRGHDVVGHRSGWWWPR